MGVPNDVSLGTLYSCVAGGTVCWTVLYLALSRTKVGNQSAEFYCRIVAVIHALIAVALSASCLVLGPNPYTDQGQPNDFLVDLTLIVSLSYFFFDLSWCFYHQTEPVIMILHHIVSIISIGMVVLERTSGAEAVHGIFSMEFTNPLLQLRWFLRTAGLKESWIHKGVEVLFFAIFIFMRLVVGTILTYSCYLSTNVKWNIKYCTMFLQAISYAFIFYMLQFIRKKYTNKKHKE